MTGPVGIPETSVSNALTPRNNPEKEIIQKYSYYCDVSEPIHNQTMILIRIN
jgi:hypothetical protein